MLQNRNPLHRRIGLACRITTLVEQLATFPACEIYGKLVQR